MPTMTTTNEVLHAIAYASALPEIEARILSCQRTHGRGMAPGICAACQSGMSIIMACQAHVSHQFKRVRETAYVQPTEQTNEHGQRMERGRSL